MKAIRYSRYEGGLEELSPEEILSLLEDFLLDSGFSDPFQRHDPDPDRAPTLEDLYDALLQALLKNASPRTGSARPASPTERRRRGSTRPSRG